MSVHVTIQVAIQMVDQAGSLSLEEFQTASAALNERRNELVPLALEANWTDLQPEGRSTVLALQNAYQFVVSQIPVPPGFESVEAGAPHVHEWLDLGELGHEFRAPLFLMVDSDTPGRPWDFIADPPGGATVGGFLFLRGRFTIE